MNHKRKKRKWSSVCGMCKAYKKAGNGKNRLKYNDLKNENLDTTI